MTDHIDLYDIHDAVFTNRTECNHCPSLIGLGIDAECVQLNESKHFNCPFVEEVYFEAELMVLGNNDELLIEFIEEAMYLDLNQEDKEAFQTRQFSEFLSRNLNVFNQKITDFFSKRVTNDNNYRGVLRD